MKSLGSKPWRTSFLSLVLSSLIMLCCGIVCFIFLLFRVHWVSWICGFIVFIKFRIFSATIFHIHVLSTPPFWYSSYMHVRLLEVISQLTNAYFSFCLFSLCVGIVSAVVSLSSLISASIQYIFHLYYIGSFYTLQPLLNMPRLSSTLSNM